MNKFVLSSASARIEEPTHHAVETMTNSRAIDSNFSS